MRKIKKHKPLFQSCKDGSVIKLFSNHESLIELSGLTFTYKGVKVFVLKEKHCGLKFSYELIPITNRTKSLYGTNSKNKHISDYTGDVKVKYLLQRVKRDIDASLQRGLTCQFNRLYFL